MRRLILGSVRARLLSEERTFACTECKDWAEVKKVHGLGDPPTCSKCGSKRIGMMEKEARPVGRTLDRVREGSKRGKKSEIWKKIDRTSRLVSKYGRTAAAALAGRGVTASAAERILEVEDEISDKFLDLVMGEEKKSMLSGYESP